MTPFKTKLLTLLNTTLAVLYLCCLLRLLVLLPLIGRRFLPAAIGDFSTIIFLMPVPSLYFVRSRYNFINIVKVALIISIIYIYPQISKHSTYSLLLFSLSISHFIHYTYQTSKYPPLSFLEYNNFFITLPLTQLSEFTLLFLSLKFSTSLISYFIKGLLIFYVPFAYVSWVHMIQRRKIKYNRYLNRGRVQNS